MTLPEDPGALSRLDDDIAPDMLDDGPNDGPSPLDLLAQATEEVKVPELPVWDVPRRPGFAVRYTLDGLDPARMQSLARRAKNRRTGEVDLDVQYALLLAHQAVELYVEGKLVTNDGHPISFGHPMVRQALGVQTAADAVRVFYGGPKRRHGFAIMQHATDLQIEAGLAGATDDEDFDDEDPTHGSTR